MFRNWPKVVFIALPLMIAIGSSAVLISERLESELERAVRLVRESASRKEEFTVQQYLYSTVYHRKDRGEEIDIEGWSTQQPNGPGTPIMVQFRYNDQSGAHVATWEVAVTQSRITPRNETASDLSWH